jgi:hypothetical protein
MMGVAPNPFIGHKATSAYETHKPIDLPLKIDLFKGN